MKQGRSDRDWAVVAVMTFGAGVLITWAITADSHAWPKLTSEQWAAWVQAIGSIAALMIGIGVPIWQRHVVSTEEARKERRLIRERCFRIRRATEAFQKRIGENLNVAEHYANGIGWGIPPHSPTATTEVEALLHEAWELPIVGAQLLGAVNFASAADDQVIDGSIDDALRPAYRKFARTAYDLCDALYETLDEILDQNSG
ncbi:hypothetical protein [Stenotrophomonas sp. SMYL86]|uniref:hypothetical protein n=1 Tax=Stenotrophomonas sp. SMYL86 TaxID=3076044 RepID=UPI002E76C0B7|nr:hypothetical protein [Stenotrophomonas sp. SMYL86]